MAVIKNEFNVEDFPIDTASENFQNIPVNILLVDDRKENLLTLGALLDDPGYEITKVTSGEAALRALLKQEFAVILLDVQMPGLDGFKTAALIRGREKTRNTPIIFVTALGKSDESVKKGYELGAVDYLFKPIEPSYLKAKVSVFAELHRQRIIVEAQAQKLIQSNRELEQFAYVASHDLQEPLRKIKSFSELLARQYQGQLDSKADDFIDYITDGAARMQRLIEGLLSYSRISTQGASPVETDFNDLVNKTMAHIDIKITESRARVLLDPLPTLKVDAGQMMQVFQNLILNAVKFRGQEDPVIRIKAEKKESSGRKGWQFSITDNGIGIDPAYRDRIFSIFQRLHLREEYPGDGMGLAICKKIIERHQGGIWMDSQGENQGTSIFFFLPRTDESQD